MDFQTALQYKNSISDSFLKTTGGARATFSFARGATPMAMNVGNRVASDVKAVGVSEKNNGENFIRVLKKEGSTLQSDRR